MLRLIVGRLIRGYRASWTPLLRGGLLVAGLLGPGGTVGSLTLQANDLTSDRVPSEVSRLIERLGSDSYATRMRAKEKLQRLGLEAFDELHNAQFHSDYEIAMAASDLVSSLQVSWSKETDPPEVREALDEYGAQNESERTSRIEMLADLPGRRGLAALVRLVRFETSLRLSRHAALALMQQSMDADAAVRTRHRELVVSTLGGNDRQASQWLRVYAQDLPTGEYSAARWRQLIQQQRQQIDSVSSPVSTRPSVLELVRVCAARAANSDQLPEALSLARENLDLIPPTTRDLIDACSWAIDNQLHPFVLDLRNEHQRMFDNQPILLYGAAEATKITGDDAQANLLAERASRIKPLPENEAKRAEMSPKELEETAQTHRLIGEKLEQRGLFHWAEREFRQIIDAMETDSEPAYTARVHLASMLGELQRFEDAADVLRPLTERIEKDDKFKQRLSSVLFAYNRIKSDQEFYAAQALIRDGDVEAAKKLLQSAFQRNPENIDILIAMHRLKSEKEWNDLVSDTLKATITRVEGEVQTAEMQVRQAGRFRLANEILGQGLNQYAWLVSNTEGDYKKALEFSLKSLELAPDGPKLDTCARCYFAVGDYGNAVRMQRRALRLMPYSPPMMRQLSEFESKLAAQQSKSSTR
jgi:tetratricopeptide (TPR) repeat protein